MTKTDTLVSKCCNATLILCGGITEGSTHYYQCAKCYQSTDGVVPVQRKAPFNWNAPKEAEEPATRMTIPQMREVFESAKTKGWISFDKPMSKTNIKEQLPKSKGVQVVQLHR